MALVDTLFSRFGLPTLGRYAGEDTDSDRAAYLTPRGGEQAGPFGVILGAVTTRRNDDDQGRTLQHERTAKFPYHAELPFWSNANLTGLIVTIDDVQWSVDLVEDLSDALATVRLVRLAAVERTRRGYRKA